MRSLKTRVRNFFNIILAKLSLTKLYMELRHQFGSLYQPVETEFQNAIDEFIQVNKRLWVKKTGFKKRVLIEGHLSDYGVNYLFRTAIAALAIQEKEKCEIDVLYNGYSHQWIIPKKVYGSFGIDRNIYLDNYFLFSNLWFRILSKIYTLRHKKNLQSVDDVLNMRFGTIKVGDLIYDDILKLNKLKTITTVDSKVIDAVEKSYYYYLQYKALFRRRKYSCYISTHSAYSEYGMLCRVALMYRIPVIETTDIQTNFYERIADNELPTYHQGIRNLIDAIFKKEQTGKQESINAAKAALSERIEAKIPQIDIQRAFSGKEYDKDDLARSLGFNEDNKLVFVMAHIFTDSPHTSPQMIYADYYVWLKETLELCKNVENVNWVVKPHPASALYDEDGLVEKMIQQLNCKNVVPCPADLNTKSIKNCADAIVTVHGTAGLEFSCFGIPVILAGKPFYSGMGFTVDPSSVEEYTKVLRSINELSRLSEEQVDTALHVLSVWNTQFDWFNPIITPEVLSNVWGSGKPRDNAAAYRLVTENLKNNDPRELRLWKAVSDQVIAE